MQKNPNWQKILPLAENPKLLSNHANLKAILPTHSELESEISFGNIKQDLSLILQSL